MTSKLRWVLGLGIAAVAITAWWGVSFWRGRVVEQQRDRAVEKVAGLMKEANWLEARSAVRAFWSGFGRELEPETARLWREMDFRISEASGDLARLVWLEQQAPELAKEMESVSLLLVRTHAAAGQKDDAVRIREDWRGREERPHLWLALDVDRHLADGEREEALALLQSHKFVGAADVGRRLRLSFLASTPTEAWNELTAAMQADPRNPDVRSFRGQLLERAGAAEEARVEFVAALLAGTEDPVRRDQLGEFYRRHDAHGLALQTWRDGLAPVAPDFLWLRVLFWQRLWRDSGEALPEPPVGNWTALINGLTELPTGVFWHDGVLPAAADLRFAEERPEVEWLRLLEQLRQGETRQAQLQLERLSEGAEALAPVAWATIRSVLRWQLQELAPSYGEMPVTPPGAQAHTLIDELRAWPAEGLSEETQQLLSQSNAWPAVMLALGWSEAALKMADARELSGQSELPEWVHYGLAVAQRENRGAAAALEYLAGAPETPLLRLLAAEMNWSAGATAEESGMAQLAVLDGPVGYRTAWLLALRALELQDWDGSQKWIAGQSDLRGSVAGRELNARAALMSGDEAAAATLYGELGLDSLEAGMFLARQAYAEARWSDARVLTEELLARFPGQLELLGNLEKIAEAERAAKAGQP